MSNREPGRGIRVAPSTGAGAVRMTGAKAWATGAAAVLAAEAGVGVGRGASAGTWLRAAKKARWADSLSGPEAWVAAACKVGGRAEGRIGVTDARSQYG